MFNTKTISGVSALFALTMGCTTPRRAEMPSPLPLGREIPSFHASINGVHTPLPQEPESMEPMESLTLRQALALALMRNPELEAFSHEVRAAEARTLQAELPHNPEMELEVESFDRDGEGYDSSEPSVILSQVIELGGKRSKRVRIAEARGEAAGWAYESKRLDVFTQTANRFASVIAAQQRFELAGSSLALAEQTSRTVDERVKSGKEPPVQRTKAIAEMEMAHLDAAEAESTLMVSCNALAAMWGTDQSNFQIATGNFGDVLDLLPSLDTLRIQLASNPDLALRKANVQMRQAALDSANAGRIPDLTIAAGVKRFEEDETQAIIFGIGVPLPLFDRNQGNITAAQHELAKEKAGERAAGIELSARLTGTHARLTSAHNRTKVLRTKVVPAMEEAYNAMLSGYKEGKYDLLNVLDAQRTLFATKSDLINALSDYHTALNDIERLTGMSITELLEKNTEEK